MDTAGVVCVRWEELFDDLEGQAASLERAERDAEIADRSRSEIGQVTLLSRLRSSEGGALTLRLADGTTLRGVLARLGADWLLISCPREVVVPVSAVTVVTDLGWDAVSPHGVSPVTSRLSLSSVLRAMAVDRARVTVSLRDGSSVAGTPDRVGRDFVDIAVHHGDETPRAATVSMRQTIAFPAISSVGRDQSPWA